MEDAHPQRGDRIRLSVGAWHEPHEHELDVPAGWEVHRLDPDDGPEVDATAVDAAFAEPQGTPPLREIARDRRRAVVAIDDITRPTPVARVLPFVLRELEAAGLPRSAVTILVGTAAHRPATPDDVAKKLGPEYVGRYAVHMHDFMGPDIRFFGRVAGGPVHLNRRFLEADLRIVIGGVIPHNETGYGGGAKMVVPGVAGKLTIAHFHGALPPRPAGRLEPEGGRLDRRAWAEAVARHVGVDFAVCCVVNSRAELAGVHVGDVVDAHRAAARRAAAVGRTPVPAELAGRAAAVLVNAWPLDTDPIQMAKSITVADKLPASLTIAVNRASDGIFYHGMGMGCGLHVPRLLRNVPRWLASPRSWGAWLQGMAKALPSPALAGRVSYFHLNALSWDAFESGEGRLAPRAPATGDDDARLLVWSDGFPAWGFRRRYRGGALYRSWPELRESWARRAAAGPVLVLPCAPLQLLEVR